MNRPFTICACVSMLAVSACLCDFIHAQRNAVRDIAAEQGDKTRELIKGEIEDAILPRLDALAKTVDARSAAGLAVVRSDLKTELDGARKDTLGFLAETNLHIGQIAESTESLSIIAEYLRAPLDESQQTLASIRTAVERASPQLDGLLAASKVTAGEAAQTMRVVRDAAPQGVAAAVQLEQHFDGIAADVERVADKYVKPKTKKEKALEILTLVGIATLHIL